MSQKYQFIADHREEYTIRVMCQALEVSESGYYSWRERPVSEHEREDARLKARIQQVFADHRGVYGSPRVQAALGKLGLQVNRKRVVRLMQELGLSAQPKRRSAPVGPPAIHWLPSLPIRLRVISMPMLPIPNGSRIAR